MSSNASRLVILQSRCNLRRKHNCVPKQPVWHLNPPPCYQTVKHQSAGSSPASRRDLPTCSCSHALLLVQQMHCVTQVLILDSAACLPASWICRRLIIMRHADSIDKQDPLTRDHERSITDLGRQAAAQVMQHLEKCTCLSAESTWQFC